MVTTRIAMRAPALQLNLGPRVCEKRNEAASVLRQSCTPALTQCSSHKAVVDWDMHGIRFRSLTWRAQGVHTRSAM